MGVELPLHELYHASTLGRMAALASKERSQLAAESIDWEAENAVPAGPPGSSLGTLPLGLEPKRQERHVLLAGVTGFLGGEILAQLIADPAVAHISCVAVPENARHRISPSPKVSVFTGSLLSPTLGLSAAEQAAMRDSADQIIHAGAQGHCLNNITSVRQANVHLTRFLAGALALPRRVPLHFVFSGRLILLRPGAVEAAPASMIDYAPPRDGSQGYTASKWASEVFLERLARETGLPVVVHRPCSVVGARAPHDDAMNSVVRYSVLSRTVPDVPEAEGFFDFQDVGFVAGEIVHGPLAGTGRRGGGGGVEFRHHSSGVRVPFARLAQRMEDLNGESFEVVSMAQWLRMLGSWGWRTLL